VVVDDLDFVRVLALPSEADPPLIVDPDAVSACSLPAEPFETIARRHPQVRECHGRIEHPKLAQSDLLHFGAEAAYRLTTEQPLSIPVTEALNHEQA
jgi:hypothetical protein